MNKRILVALIAAGALTAPSVARADVVTDWNKTMVDALYATHTAPQPSSRIGAIVQASVFDAVNGISRRFEQFHPEVLNATAPPGASRRAAAASAAYRALSALLPSQQAAFDAQYASTLASLPAGSQSVARGLAWGQTVADAMLAWRSTDGFTAVLPPYVIGPLPFWQPTPPGFVATPVFRQFATMTPWTMSSSGQFLPPPPPALTSARYTASFQEVKSIGNAATATPADVETAKFWAGQFDTPVTMWDRVAESLVAPRARLVDTARLYAFLNASMADAMIAIWNAKNVYNAWRPVTAIRNADMDGNPAAALDTTWTPVLDDAGASGVPVRPYGREQCRHRRARVLLREPHGVHDHVGRPSGAEQRTHVHALLRRDRRRHARTRRGRDPLPVLVRRGRRHGRGRRPAGSPHGDGAQEGPQEVATGSGYTERGPLGRASLRRRRRAAGDL